MADEPSGPKVFRVGELDDLELLPKRFDFFVSETRDTLALIVRKLDRITGFVERHERLALDAHKDILRIKERLAGMDETDRELERRLSALEESDPPIVPIRRKAARK